ncbi:MAG: DUF4249 family protein [Bacteroidales bacterium]|nr:DUF4249 family protein [Bacteroidales bacterium]
MGTKRHTKVFLGMFLAAFWLCSCTEDITIAPPEGRRRPVVEGRFTNELKRHEVVLSYTSELYTDSIEMIPNAIVYVEGGGDTIYFHEQDGKPGHYLSDSVAGRKHHWYHLEIQVPENTLLDFPLRIYADSYMPKNVDQIDSLRLLPLLTEEGIPFVDEQAAVCVCPYFQALPDSNMVYNVELFLNGNHFKNRPSQLMNLFSMRGYAGYYFNGPEMLEDNIEVPVGIMNKSYMREGSVVKLKLHSITRDYLYFLYNQKLSVGSNPIMGAFPANITNIFSNCDAIGWFSTTSVVSAEAVYHEWE